MKKDGNEKRERGRVTWGDVFPKYRISMLDNGKTKKIRVEGAKKLLLCTEKDVKIFLGEENLHIAGGGLSCTAYTSGALEISGNVCDMTFVARKETKERWV